MKICEQF